MYFNAYILCISDQLMSTWRAARFLVSVRKKTTTRERVDCNGRKFVRSNRLSFLPYVIIAFKRRERGKSDKSRDFHGSHDENDDACALDVTGSRNEPRMREKGSVGIGRDKCSVSNFLRSSLGRASARKSKESLDSLYAR